MSHSMAAARPIFKRRGGLILCARVLIVAASATRCACC